MQNHHGFFQLLDLNDQLHVRTGEIGRQLVKQLHQRVDLRVALGLNGHGDLEIVRRVVGVAGLADDIDIFRHEILDASLDRAELGRQHTIQCCRLIAWDQHPLFLNRRELAAAAGEQPLADECARDAGAR